MKTPILHRLWAKALTQFFFSVFSAFAAICIFATAAMASYGFYAKHSYLPYALQDSYYIMFNRNWARVGYYNRALIPLLGIGALILAIIFFVFAMRGAGHKAEREGIVRAFPAKIPLDISLVLAISTGALIAALPYWAVSFLTIESTIILALVCLAAEFYLLIGYCIGLSANIKQHTWWKNMLIYLLYRGIAFCVRSYARLCVAKLNRIPLILYTLICGLGLFLSAVVLEEFIWWEYELIVLLCFLFAVAFVLCFLIGLVTRFKTKGWWRNTLCYGIYRICRKAPLFWQVGLAFAGLCLVDLFLLALATGEAGAAIILFLLLRTALLALVIWITLAMRRLQKGGKQLAMGDMRAQLSLKGMFGVFRDHAENLNRIRGGMQAEVEERMRSEHFKTELITNVSHDIKTPLTSIINYVDLLGKLALDNADAKVYLEVLERQSARLKKLTEDLIEASKAATGNVPVSLSDLDACALLQQLSAEYEDRFEKAGLQIVSQFPQAAPLIHADPALLHRVFDNLFANIEKYALRGTRVYLAVENRENTVAYTFRNISRDALPPSAESALLERFVRGDSARNSSGSGLGLSIARSLLELMEGTLTLAVDGDLFKVSLELPKSKM